MRFSGSGSVIDGKKSFVILDNRVSNSGISRSHFRNDFNDESVLQGIADKPGCSSHNQANRSHRKTLHTLVGGCAKTLQCISSH